MSGQQAERRRHKRVNVDRSVLDNKEFKAIDLSESGMGLSCLTEQRKGRVIELDLTIEGQEILLKGEVMWCQGASSVFETGYHVGVQFVGHSVSQQLLIRDFVSKHAGD